jgi:HK97 family phage major capsid protein
MTPKHKELLARFDTRTKELNSFLEANQDLSAAQYAEATKIRDDVTSIKAEIEQCKATEALAGEAAQFRSYLEEPSGMRHQVGQTRAIGSTKAGSVTLAPRQSRAARQARKILNDSGAGVFGQKAWDAVQSPEYRKAFCAYLRGGERTAGVHFRNLEEGLDPSGGYLAPVEVISKLIEKKPTPTRVAGLCDTINTSRDAISLPRVNYTTNSTDDANGYIYTTGFRATLTDENPTSDTQSVVNDTALFGSVRVSVYTYLIEGILTNNMVEDAMFDPMAWMSGKFAETIELLKDNLLINGTGASQPMGLLANPGGSDTLTYPPTIASGAPTAPFLTADGLVTLTEGIPEQYDANIRYLYQKTSTGVTVRTLKDANGRYLFSRGIGDDTVVVGRQSSLNGYPVIHSQFMPAPATSGAGQYPVVAGDFSGLTLVNRVGFSIQVLREVAARRNQVILLGKKSCRLAA